MLDSPDDRYSQLAVAGGLDLDCSNQPEAAEVRSSQLRSGCGLWIAAVTCSLMATLLPSCPSLRASSSATSRMERFVDMVGVIGNQRLPYHLNDNGVQDEEPL